jgi:acyl-CoA thioesterase-1
MNWLVFHVASGQSFFTGVALIVIAALASMASKRAIKRITALAFLTGAIAVAVSSTPIPYWYYAVAVAVTLAWIVSGYLKNWRHWSAFAVIAVWTIAVAIELPYHVTPQLDPASPRTLTIIGDSVTAGMGGEDNAQTWPNILAKEHDIEVHDISHVGETAASALRRTKDIQFQSPVVILAIGGNDLLGSTSSARFSHDLDALLAHVTSPKRQVIMFELPLPPFSHEYGRVQRSRAHKYGVSLIPKRVLLGILGGDESTLDTIHLSQAGHRRMATCVWQIVGSAFPTAAPHNDVNEPEP